MRVLLDVDKFFFLGSSWVPETKEAKSCRQVLFDELILHKYQVMRCST